MNIIYKKVSELIPYARNNKIHSERQIKLIAGSIQEFGFTQPIVVDDKNSIIIGHARAEAAKLAGLEEVPCYVANELSKAQIKALRIADNKLSSLAEWDNEMLSLELQELQELDVDLEILGFDDLEIDDFLDEEQDIEEDEVPEVEDNPYSKMGDLWLLGRHRLLCGDSTDKATVERLMDGKKADMVFTDPPYGMDYQLNTTKNKIDKIKGDEKDFDISYVWEMIKKVPIKYICTRFDKYVEWQNKINEKVKNIIVWKKSNMGAGDLKNYGYQHEFIMYWGKSIEGKRDTNVWDEGNTPKKEYVNHPTQKPVSLVKRAIKNHSVGFVLDLFGGSGSTLIAAEQTNRICFMMELDEKYIDVIVKRYHNLGKEDITLIRDGKEYKWEDMKVSFV